MQYASENLIPVTMELGGKSPNIFFESVAGADDAFFDKAVEGAVMFALNQGEVCTCPSRILVHEKIYDQFMKRVIQRTNAILMGNPLDSRVMMGAQASEDQYKKILSYLDIGKQEGAEVLCGGEAFHQNSGLEHGYYIKQLKPTQLPISGIEIHRLKGIMFKPMWKQIKKNKFAYMFLAPTATAMFFLHFLPIVQGFYMAFLKLDQFTLSRYLLAPFVGLQNFNEVLINAKNRHTCRHSRHPRNWMRVFD